MWKVLETPCQDIREDAPEEELRTAGDSGGIPWPVIAQLFR